METYRRLGVTTLIVTKLRIKLLINRRLRPNNKS
nr:MAG TPA: hypothetical protein [Herelleviridae sp.]